jgi:predicted DCC family thiol-disulfide oxidoreductase YuxK
MVTVINHVQPIQASIVMTTATAQADKVLIYDGDCPMCRATIGKLLHLRLVRPEQTRSNHDLQGPDLEAAQAAGLRNELVVLNPESRETRSGTDGLLWIIRDNTGNHPLVRLASLPGFRDILRWGYQAISYNRRIISPPRHQIVCDCEPQVTVARRLSLIVPLLLLTALLAAAFGAALFTGAEKSPVAGAVVAILAAGAGWFVLIVAAIAFLKRDKRIDYVGHSAVTMFIGSLVLVPATLIALVAPRDAALALAGVSLAISLVVMVKMQKRRVTALGISQVWLASWPVALVGGVLATCWFYFDRYV